MAFEFKSPKDKWVKCISNSGTIRAAAISATDTANILAQRHQNTEIGTLALSEALVAGLLLATYSKGEEKMNLNIQGSGWCYQAIVDANANAEVRGYIREREQKDVHLAKGVGPWGIGLLSVLRTKTEEAQPYIGTVPLLTGRLPKDLTFYWLQSEQVQSAVGIQVFMENQKVTMAEGFLIQALPGATDEDLRFIEQHLIDLNQFGSEDVQRSTPIHLLAYLLENQSFSILEEKPITLKCHCSLDRVKRSLMLIGAEEIQSMIEEKKDFEINCDFCSEQYVIDTSELESILKGTTRS